ncbi:hypothetical protein F4859DRAFT_483356 [Xylaria cf. heliscus]|nr:hypothetical protein F4859DRAFT_483356 [Xylaria cf. heliscus]
MSGHLFAIMILPFHISSTNHGSPTHVVQYGQSYRNPDAAWGNMVLPQLLPKSRKEICWLIAIGGSSLCSRIKIIITHTLPTQVSFLTHDVLKQAHLLKPN